MVGAEHAGDGEFRDYCLLYRLRILSSLKNNRDVSDCVNISVVLSICLSGTERETS